VPQRVKSARGEWSVPQLTAVTIPPLLARFIVSGGSVAKVAGYRLGLVQCWQTVWRARATSAYKLRRNSFVCPVLKGKIMSWSLS